MPWSPRGPGMRTTARCTGPAGTASPATHCRCRRVNLHRPSGPRHRPAPVNSPARGAPSWRPAFRSLRSRAGRCRIHGFLQGRQVKRSAVSAPRPCAAAPARRHPRSREASPCALSRCWVSSRSTLRPRSMRAGTPEAVVLQGSKRRQRASLPNTLFFLAHVSGVTLRARILTMQKTRRCTSFTRQWRRSRRSIAGRMRLPRDHRQATPPRACKRKKRSISADASGPAGSV